MWLVYDTNLCYHQSARLLSWQSMMDHAGEFTWSVSDCEELVVPSEEASRQKCD